MTFKCFSTLDDLIFFIFTILTHLASSSSPLTPSQIFPNCPVMKVVLPVRGDTFLKLQKTFKNGSVFWEDTVFDFQLFWANKEWEINDFNNYTFIDTNHTINNPPIGNFTWTRVKDNSTVNITLNCTDTSAIPTKPLPNFIQKLRITSSVIKWHDLFTEKTLQDELSNALLGLYNLDTIFDEITIITITKVNGQDVPKLKRRRQLGSQTTTTTSPSFTVTCILFILTYDQDAYNDIPDFKKTYHNASFIPTLQQNLSVTWNDPNLIVAQILESQPNVNNNNGLSFLMIVFIVIFVLVFCIALLCGIIAYRQYLIQSEPVLAPGYIMFQEEGDTEPVGLKIQGAERWQPGGVDRQTSANSLAMGGDNDHRAYPDVSRKSVGGEYRSSSSRVSMSQREGQPRLSYVPPGDTSMDDHRPAVGNRATSVISRPSMEAVMNDLNHDMIMPGDAVTPETPGQAIIEPETPGSP